MSIHPATRELDLYLSGKLPPAELLKVDAHVSTCSECQGYFKPDVEALASALRGSSEASRHLSHEILERYAEGRLSESAKVGVEAHLELCTDCREQLQDFRSFFEAIARPLDASEAPGKKKIYALEKGEDGTAIQSNLKGRGVAGRNQEWERAAYVIDRPPSKPVSRTEAFWAWFRQPRHALALAAIVLLACIVPLWRHSDSSLPISNSARLDGGGRLDQIPEPQRGRVRALLQGARPQAPMRTLSELSPQEREQWAALTTSLANDPVALAAVAMDLGLYCDARRLLENQDGESGSRQFLDAAAAQCPAR
jgi:anti-sigma factor RsiW